MKNDFEPVMGHRFNLRADWGAGLSGPGTGTHLRMEQSGFRPDQQQAYQGEETWAERGRVRRPPFDLKAGLQAR